MSTITDSGASKYAARFYAETTGQGRPLQPTDSNLTETLKGCILRPKPEWHQSIRRVLAEEYGVTLGVEGIIRQGTTDESFAREAAAILKARKTSELMDDYRESKRTAGEDASEVRRWITAELIDRLGREPVVTFEERVSNEARERTILASDARKGDIYVTRGHGLYMRREIVAVSPRSLGASVHFLCADGTTPLLDAGRVITVERDDDPDPDTDSPAVAGADEEAAARQIQHPADESDPDTTSTAREVLFSRYHAAARERDHGADRARRRAGATEANRVAGELSRLGVWVFNRDYHDLAQIIPFIDSYWTVYEQIKAAGSYPYNANFEGRIPGLTDALPREETPIYLLQQLRGLVEGHERLAELLNTGYQRLTQLDTRQRFASVVVLDRFYAARRFEDARVIPDEQHRPSGVLPKGNRTRGVRVRELDQLYVR